MKSKLIALSFITLSLAAATGAVMNGSEAHPKSAQQQVAELEQRERRQGLTLKERARLAKLKGQRSLAVRQSYKNMDFARFAGLDAALAGSTVVIARPVKMKSLVDEDGAIQTAYKFKLVEVLSEAAAQKYPYTFKGDPPAELQPFAADEFLVGMRGGTVEMDGVEVTTSYDDYEPFALSQQYLLFLEFDTTRRVGMLTMGPASVFLTNADGTLETLNRRPHAIKNALDERFGNSVEKLKTGLRSRQ